MEEALNELLAEGDPWPLWDDGIYMPADAPDAGNSTADKATGGKNKAASMSAASTGGAGSSGDSGTSAVTAEGGAEGGVGGETASRRAEGVTKRAASGGGTKRASAGGTKRQYKRVRTEKLVAQNCAAQRRYRQRKKEKEMELEAGVQGLQASLDTLQEERDTFMKKLELAEGILRLREAELEMLKGASSPTALLAPTTSADTMMLNEFLLRQPLLEDGDAPAPGVPELADGIMDNDVQVLSDNTSEGIIAAAKRYPVVRALLQTLSAVNDGVEIADPNLNLIWVNSRYTEITGYTWAEAIGHTPKELVKSDLNSPSVYQSICSTVKSGLQWKGQYYNKRKDGTHFLQESTIFAVRDEANVPIVYVSIRRPILTTDGKPWPVQQPAKLEEVENGGGCNHAGCLIACN